MIRIFNLGALKILLAQSAFINHGIDLVRCTCLLILEPVYDHKDQKQLQFRLQRIGQTNLPQKILTLMYRDTFEDKIFEFNKDESS